MDVQLAPKHQLVGVPDTEALANLYPDALVVKGLRLIPHEPACTNVLRAHGYNVPSPVLSHYKWPGALQPFEVQRKTCSLLTQNERAYVLNDMGTGKTAAALWAWDYLRSNSLAGKLLVVSPLSTMRVTWAKEVFSVVPHRKATVLHGTKQQRLQKLAAGDESGFEVYILNHDGIKVIFDELVERADIDTLIIDELAVCRHGGTDRTRMLRRLASRMKYVWGMTGRPIPNSPTDAWAQASIVTPNTVPKYFGRFREQVMFKKPNGQQWGWEPKPDAVDQAFKALQPAVRYTLDDVVELPECIERWVDVDLTEQQKQIYAAVQKKAIAAIANKEITAVNAAAAMTKLLQISAGWVYSSSGDTIALASENRVQALVDAVDGCAHKCLVFVPFKHALAGISEVFRLMKIEHAIVSGDTPEPERARIFGAFQNTDKYHAIVAHPQCLAHGITLTAADTVIWYAPVTSLDIYDQANARIRRVGQQHKQLVLHLQATPVEKKVYAMLRDKQKVQDHLLELFESASE